MMSPAKASSSSSRRCDRKVTTRVRPQLLAGAHDLQPHAALEVARGDAHEGDAVAVRRVHVGLDLEDHAAELRLVGLHRALRSPRAVARRRRQVDQRVEHLAHAEVVDRRAEEHRRLAGRRGTASRSNGGAASRTSSISSLGLLVLACRSARRRPGCRGRRGSRRRRGRGPRPARTRASARSRRSITPWKTLPMPTGQVKGTTAMPSSRSISSISASGSCTSRSILLTKVRIGVLRARQTCEQPPRLRLDAVGRVDHHQRRVDRGQHAVGVFGEVLVAGRVEQVDDAVAVLHLHHRRGDRDAALLLDLHPVGGGVARGLARLHRAGDLDRAGEQQQLLGQRGLARVGVGNDGEGAAAAHLGGEVGHREEGRRDGAADGARIIRPRGRPSRRWRTSRRSPAGTLGRCPRCPTSPSMSSDWPRRVVGQRLQRVKVLNPFLVRTAVPPIAAAEGRRVEGVERLGKRIVLGLEGELFLVIHLMIAGRLQVARAGSQAAGPDRAGAVRVRDAGTLRAHRGRHAAARLAAPARRAAPRSRRWTRAAST